SGGWTRRHGAHLRIPRPVKGGNQRATLRDLTNSEIADGVAGPAGDMGAANRDAAARGFQDSGDCADQGRLAGAVGAHDCDNRSLLDRKLYAVERLGVAVEYIEALDCEHQSASAPR